MPTDRREEAAKIQQEYYEQTAAVYDRMHSTEQEHEFAIAWLMGLIDYYDINSVLDIGSGTGRLMRRMQSHPRCSRFTMLGIEPVAALREQGHKHGINETALIDGDVTDLQFPDESFDLVCEFGTLHHVGDPEQAIREMLRVAKKAIFISDMNNYGSGSFLERLVKQLLRTLGLWRMLQFVKTGGKRYKISEGDGLFYSYSVYDNYRQIARSCNQIHVLNTSEQGINPYRSCGHVALLAIKTGLDRRTTD